MISPDFLAQIYWEERCLELEIQGKVDLPAYAGSTMRGAIGTVMRPELCGRGGTCVATCEEPECCSFYALFEQSRAENGHGSNIPKPLILEAPLAEPLRAIAMGATVEPPYQLQQGRPIPTLANSWRMGFEEGYRVKMVLRGLGAAGAALDGTVQGIRSKGLEVRGGRLRLVGVEGGRSTLSVAPFEENRRVKLALVTPLVIRQAGGLCLDPTVLGQLVLDQALIRAVSIYNAFFARAGERIPFVQPAWPGVSMTANRLFAYQLPRQSYRQERWMNFEGVVGWLEWEGETGKLLPWLRAAEVLHIGQKATFGLGRVELMPESRWVDLC